VLDDAARPLSLVSDKRPQRDLMLGRNQPLAFPHMTSQKPSELGRYIRSRRKALGVSIRDFATRIGKSPTFVVLLETQPTPPSTTDELLVALSSALEASVDELFSLVRKVPAEALPSTADEVALFRRVQRMTDREKSALLAKLSKKQRGE
jgi:transcriptional regulator with XRE-family HTH domain